MTLSVLKHSSLHGDRGRSRTCGLSLRRGALYPLSYECVNLFDFTINPQLIQVWTIKT